MKEIEIGSTDKKYFSVGPLQEKRSADGFRILRYFTELSCAKLRLHKELSAPNIYLLQSKIDSTLVSWRKRIEAVNKKSAIADARRSAEEVTADAKRILDGLSSILAYTLSIDDRVDWESLKDRAPYPADPRFREPEPMRRSIAPPRYAEPKIGLADLILGRKARRLSEAEGLHNDNIMKWRKEEESNATIFARQSKEWKERKVAFDRDYASRKQKYLQTQVARNSEIDALAAGVATGDVTSIIEHANLVLERSQYGDLFEKSIEIDYDGQSKVLLIEYRLPAPGDLPTLKSVRLMPSTGELRETHVTSRESNENFDKVCYQICLRTIHEIFESDEHENVSSVSFNGIIDFIDKTTGKDSSSCILSILVGRSDFESIDLSRVDAKACFKKLKGISASALHALVAVPPIIDMNREDRRFIDARSVVGGIGETTNLASMDWGDFEHLVREVFEKEFSKRGGEVKVTQSSSDGGVDAVAFDPDPITGGKFVIQAKRYTRTVGVSTVRDLYGTMQHEGASRGILITTADYGPDAYQFASGKPITLISGANLLHLLEKHGYKAKIDLREARKALNLSE